MMFIKNVNLQETCAQCKVLTSLTRCVYTLLLRQNMTFRRWVILLIQKVENAQGLFSQIITLHRFYRLLEPHCQICVSLQKEKKKKLVCLISTIP